MEIHPFNGECIRELVRDTRKLEEQNRRQKRLIEDMQNTKVWKLYQSYRKKVEKDRRICMEQQVCEIRRERFHLLEPDVYLLQGTIPEGSEVTAYLDEVRIEADTEDWVAESALERFREDELLNGRKVTVSVRFPSNLEEYKELKVYVSDQEEKVLWFCIKVKELLKRKDRPQYYVDEEAIDLKTKPAVCGDGLHRPVMSPLKFLTKRNSP